MRTLRGRNVKDHYNKIYDKQKNTGCTDNKREPFGLLNVVIFDVFFNFCRKLFLAFKFRISDGISFQILTPVYSIDLCL